MKYYTFFRENNNFDDIESDSIIKKFASTKLRWYQHFMIGMQKGNNDKNFSMLTLKYSEDMVNNLIKDFTPVIGVDYVPKKTLM
jgi:membrane-bound acyltransferase YfiQ involved in biofilm formation